MNHLRMFKKLIQRLQKKNRVQPIKSWEIVDKMYASPRPDSEVLTKIDGYTAEKALFGVTTIIFQDKYTGEIIIKEVLGGNEKSVDEIFKKALERGTVRYTWGDETFIISKLLKGLLLFHSQIIKMLFFSLKKLMVILSDSTVLLTKGYGYLILKI